MQEYGQLVVLGYSSYRVASSNHRTGENRRHTKKWEPVGRPNAKFVMRQRPVPNGVKISCPSVGESNSQSGRRVAQSHLFIPIDERSSCAVEFCADSSTDMFQIGRMPVAENDFVVPGPLYGVSGTVSRYAARIICSREPPYSCAIYAAGFDSRKCIRLPLHASKWCGLCQKWLKQESSSHDCVAAWTEGTSHRVMWDALTKNGVRLWLPEYDQWFEVSVNGNLFPIEPKMSRDCGPETPKLRKAAFNRPNEGPFNIPPMLTNGCIIDLGGIQLQYQVSCAQKPIPVPSVASQLDAMSILCPVQLHSLRFSSTHVSQQATPLPAERIPHVYPACGHVFGYNKRLTQTKRCPLCRTQGFLVPLLLSEFNDLDSLMPDRVLNPCGHAISNVGAEYYSKLHMPNGRSICPFCAVHLNAARPYSKLYLYTEINDSSKNENDENHSNSIEETQDHPVGEENQDHPMGDDSVGDEICHDEGNLGAGSLQDAEDVSHNYQVDMMSSNVECGKGCI